MNLQTHHMGNNPYKKHAKTKNLHFFSSVLSKNILEISLHGQADMLTVCEKRVNPLLEREEPNCV